MRLPRVLLLAALASTLASGPAGAQSTLRFERPTRFGDVPAATYDDAGRWLGPASQRVTQLPSGHVLIESKSGVEGAESMEVMAELEPDDQGGLRLVWEKSHSVDAGRRALGIMWIDHRAGWATCTPPEDGDGAIGSIALPTPDRVANVPMNLLLLPVALGEETTLAFDFLVCHGPRIVPARASIARKSGAGGHPWVEVRYDLDFGPLTALARPFLPHFAFWFDPSSPDAWVAHRIPLGAGAREVLVVRGGVSPATLDAIH